MQSWLENLQTFMRKVSIFGWIIIGGAGLLFIGVVVAVIVVAAKPAPKPAQTVKKTVQPVAFDPSHGKCTGKGTVPLAVSPIAADQLGLAVPMGQMSGAQVTPTDHGTMLGLAGHGASANQYDVHAPADGIITELAVTSRGKQDPTTDHAITISFTCSQSVHLTGLDSFSSAVAKAAGNVTATKPWTGAIHVKAGDIIGKTGPHGVNLYAWNRDKKLQGYVRAEQYAKAEPWRLYTADPYSFFTDPAKAQLLAKNPRTATPRGGKTNYDVEGGLLGNWFVQATGGYGSGAKAGKGVASTTNHLSFAPDPFDPTGIVVSIGNWQGAPRQFSLVGNRPLPKDVTTGSGLVKYELHPYHWNVTASGQPWDGNTFQGPLSFVTDPKVEGVLLIQVSADRTTVKVEQYPGVTAKKVTGFGPNTVIYER